MQVLKLEPEAAEPCPAAEATPRAILAPQQLQSLFTPCKLPDTAGLGTAQTPSSNAFTNTLNTRVDRVFSPYPCGAAKSRASPFIPFCRDNLSPLCAVDGNFTSNASKRVLFTPLYISAT